MDRKLINEQSISKKSKSRKVYAITELGLNALRNVKEINNALHVFDELNVSSIELHAPLG